MHSTVHVLQTKAGCLKFDGLICTLCTYQKINLKQHRRKNFEKP